MVFNNGFTKLLLKFFMWRSFKSKFICSFYKVANNIEFIKIHINYVNVKIHIYYVNANKIKCK